MLTKIIKKYEDKLCKLEEDRQSFLDADLPFPLDYDKPIKHTKEVLFDLYQVRKAIVAIRDGSGLPDYIEFGNETLMTYEEFMSIGYD